MDDPALAYNRLVEADARAAEEQAQWLAAEFRRARIIFDGEPMRTCLRPHFVARAEWEALRVSGRRLLPIASRVAREVFGGDVGALCAFLGTPEAEARWVRLDPGAPDVVLSRLDAFLGAEGPRFIEINSDAPAGFGYGDRMAAVFAELPVFRAFARDRRVSYAASGVALVQAVLETWAAARPGGAAPVIAIVDWADVKTRADQEILGEAFERAGHRCRLADPRDFVVAGGRLRVGESGEVIDLVYRRALLSELVEREAEAGALLGAYRDGRAVFVNSFRCRLAEDKAFFAILTDEAFEPLLGAEELDLVRRVVPWTRRIAERRTLRAGREIDLVPHVLARREELVLKPAHGYGGRAVLVGEEATPEAWSAAVESGLREPWVVQERVAIPEEVFPVIESGGVSFQALKVNVNPFYAAGAEVGAVTRASRSSIINVSAGGGSLPTFVIG